MSFSILIPSWNNLTFLQLCIESIRKKSAEIHQIIVHVNEGKDGTLEWVRSEGLDFTYTESNVGVCIAMNMMRPKVKTEYMVFLNDDMYVLPDWDKVLINEINSLPDNRFFLSSTTIQPHTSGSSIILANYGDSIESFNERSLLEDYKKLHGIGDWMGATIPPNIVHRDIWDLVGGYSVELSPGMYSDPDFTAKLWFCGIKYMKGLDASRVYQFESKSTERVKKNNGQIQFLMKRGITSSSFRRL
jgi:glycosyltransferase involved in cell wall biosynthesis